MLKYRLIFGILIALFFTGMVILGGYLDGSLTSSAADDKAIQGTLLCVLIGLLAIPAQLEMASLVRNVGAKFFTPVAIVSSVLLATSWYVRQFADQPAAFHLYYLLFVIAFSVLALFAVQARKFGTEGTIANCSASLLSIFYLGFLSSFVLAVRIEFGVWPLLMFVATVKSSDTGAYIAGRIFGKHKFAPKISPGKTWEGLAGAIGLAVIVALIFAGYCGIMSRLAAVIFAVVFAVGGQLADLVESMFKRDAKQKDSSHHVPGFGGILDVIDSPLGTAPAAYLFFMLVCDR